MHVYATLSACTDCLAFVANNDTPADRPNLRAEIDAHWGELAVGLVPGSEELGFSHAACECCHSHLAGDRHELAILQP